MSRFNDACTLCDHGSFSWKRAALTHRLERMAHPHQLPLLERTCTNCGNADVLGSDGSALSTAPLRGPSIEYPSPTLGLPPLGRAA